MDGGRRAVVWGCGLAGVAVVAEVVRSLAEGAGVQVLAYQSFLAIAGPLVLVAVGAGYVATVERAPPDAVVAGFLPGAVLYCGGLLALQWLESYHALTAALDILPFHLVLTAGFVLLAALGAASGHLIGPLLQEPTQ